MSRTPAVQFMLGLLVSLVGTGLLMAGLAFYALAKGRSPAWCLMGLLSIIGLIVLACLKDLAPEGKIGRGKRRRDDDYEDEEDIDRPRPGAAVAMKKKISTTMKTTVPGAADPGTTTKTTTN